MNCLRCGRTVPEEVLFCPECAHHDRNRPTKVSKTAFVSAEEQAVSLARKLKRRNRRLRRWLAAMILLALLSCSLLGYSAIRTAAQRQQLITQISRANSLQTALENVQADLTAANALTDSMKEVIARYQAITGLSPEDLT